MAEAMKIMVRCRPMNARENGLGCKDVICIDERQAQCSIKNPHDGGAPPKAFTFDGAYGVKSTNQQIYSEICFPLVEGVTEGYNGMIFTYGQIGSGKSFTMQGTTDPATQKGIIPRAFDHIFKKIQVTEGAKYLIHASYLEIYNEEIRDLLGKDIKQKLELKEHPDKGVYVENLSMHLCKNVRTCEQVMEHGWKNRSTGATLMNADSSRSHSIFTIHMERVETDGKEEEHIRVAKLNLVDLAGSEQQGNTGATGDRLKEATKINLSLLALGNVISCLVDGKSTHIPYRDSKLTRLLQDSLGGTTKTLMVACLSPADNNYEETLSTLLYASYAKNVKNKPKMNEDPKDALLREYQDEIKRLKTMLTGQLPLQLPPGEASREKAKNLANRSGLNETNQKLEIEKEKRKIKEEFENEIRQMKEELSAVKASKDEVELMMNNLRSQYDEKVAEVEKGSQNKQIKSRRSDLMDETEKNFTRTDTFTSASCEASQKKAENEVVESDLTGATRMPDVTKHIETEQKKMKQELEEEMKQIKTQTSLAMEELKKKLSNQLFFLKKKYSNKVADVEKQIKSTLPSNVLPKQSRKKRTAAEDSSKDVPQPKKAKLQRSSKLKSETADTSSQLGPRVSAGEDSKVLSAESPKPNSEPELPSFVGIERVVFLDLDNWQRHFLSLLSHFTNSTLFWGFSGGQNVWKEPLEDPVYTDAKSSGHVFLNKRCGPSKDASDFAISLMVGFADAVVSKSVHFCILSGDTGFEELQEQFRSDDKRQLRVVNPHHLSAAQVISLMF